MGWGWGLFSARGHMTLMYMSSISKWLQHFFEVFNNTFKRVTSCMFVSLHPTLRPSLRFFLHSSLPLSIPSIRILFTKMRKYQLSYIRNFQLYKLFLGVCVQLDTGQPGNIWLGLTLFPDGGGIAQ